MDIWCEDVQVDLVNASIHFIDAYQLKCFYDALNDPQITKTDSMRKVLEQLYLNYAIFVMRDDMTSFYGTGFFATAKDTRVLNDLYLKSMNEIREYALGLVDAFNF